MSALLIGTELNITASGTDNVTVRANVTSGLVEVLDQNGLLASLPSVSASAVQALTITGGDNANVIDLSGVIAAQFTLLPSIQVNGGDGNDRITGSPDLANSLNGGDGSDVLLGGSVNDTLNGGNGADAITGGLGNDSLLGGDGADTLSGDAGLDTLEGGNGADLLSAGDDNDSVNGGNGADNLDGGQGNDTLNGDGGSDTITGGADNDTIYGGAENDSILGGSGNDSILAQAGNDTVDGEAGNDTLFGGDGTDSVSGGVGDDTISGDAGHDTISGDDGDDSLLGGAGNDSMVGGLGDDTLIGQAGNDTVNGGGGVDSVDGGAGNDLVSSQSTTVGILINDVTISEGDVGTVNAIFTIGLTIPSTQTVMVNFSTSGGTAISGTDFLPVSNGLVTFLPNVTTQTISVQIIGDTAPEPSETFFVNLSNAVNAVIVRAQGQGTITDADAPASVTLTAANNVNASRLLTNNDESAIIINPANSQQLFAFANNGARGMFAARSVDGGQTWLPSFGADFIIVDGNDALPSAISDPSLTWDSFGNLYLSYIATAGDVAVALSTDAGQTFSLLTRLGGNRTDQETLVIGPGTSGVGNTVWITYDDGGRLIRGASVTGLGVISAFSAAQVSNVGQFGDIAVGPNGQVTITGQTNAAMLFQTDPDGLGPLGFGPVTNLPVNVDTFDAITPQTRRTIDAEAGLAYDRTGGPFNGRLYLLYTDEIPDESNNTEIFSRFSTDNGATWSARVRVNDDATNRAQFFSKIALDQTTGAVGAAWQDARNDPANTLVETFVAVTIDGGATWSPNVRVSAGQTNGQAGATGGQQLGDYIGLTFNAGQLHPSWADNSNSTGDNPNGTLNALDVYTSRVNVAITTSGGPGGVNVGTALPSLTDVGDTLSGGEGDDTVVGASGNDIINGSAGNDSLSGADGNDTIFGGAGADTINGAGGDDSLDGQGGNDVLDGGIGDDQLVWGGASGGKDTLLGTAGYDTVVVNGTGAADSLTVSQNAARQLTVTQGAASLVLDAVSVSNVVINGNGGNDSITIGSVPDTLAVLLTVNGGDGNDTLSAAGASLGMTRLQINGNAGNDSLTGSASDDSLDGGDGDDVLLGGLGNDVLLGGAGIDRLNGDAGDDSLNGGDDNDVLRGFDGNDSIVGGNGDDSVLAGNGNDTVSGDAGADTINGEAGNDSLSGSFGADTLSGGDGADTLDGGTESDSLSGNAGDDLLRGGDGNDSIDAGDGNDTIIGGDGDDQLLGGNGNDAINGSDGNDFLNGGAGNDTLLGSNGNDTLRGGSGNDVLLGGDGDDNLDGQGGADTIAGNEGVDTLSNTLGDLINETFALPAALLTALEA